MLRHELSTDRIKINKDQKSTKSSNKNAKIDLQQQQHKAPETRNIFKKVNVARERIIRFNLTYMLTPPPPPTHTHTGGRECACVSGVPMCEKKTTRKGTFFELGSAQRCHLGYM